MAFAIEKYLQKVYDAKTFVNHPISIGIGSTIVLPINIARKHLLLQNDSDTIIYVNLGAAAVLNNGIRLNANGGTYTISATNGNLFVGEIYAITTVGGKLLIAIEGV